MVVYQEKFLIHLIDKKLEIFLNEIDIPKVMGVIVRTAGANKTKNEIEKDFQNTLKTWEEIKDKALRLLMPIFSL